MKRNKGFRINNLLWPIIIFGMLGIVAIWVNIDGLSSGRLPGSSGEAAPSQPWAMNLSAQNTQGLPANVPAASVPAARTALQVQDAIGELIAVVRPCVVSVTRPATTQSSAPGASGGLMHLDPYSDGQNPVGSGIIVDHRGYVLTSFLTVGKAKQVRVTLFSATRSEYDADLVAVDPKTDLALLKIRSNEVFPAAILANSDMVQVGDIVFAIGSPFGFSKTVTMGIVSSRRRQINIEGIKYPEMIQTDAAINGGNDGGALVNIRGEVIGINMATFMPDNHFSGIGFAIPINDAINFMDANM